MVIQSSTCKSTEARSHSNILVMLHAPFSHGGPGGGCMANNRRFFDPAVYRIILMDQRGAGKSRPPAELRVQ